MSYILKVIILLTLNCIVGLLYARGMVAWHTKRGNLKLAKSYDDGVFPLMIFWMFWLLICLIERTLRTTGEEIKSTSSWIVKTIDSFFNKLFRVSTKSVTVVLDPLPHPMGFNQWANELDRVRETISLYEMVGYETEQYNLRYQELMRYGLDRQWTTPT